MLRVERLVVDRLRERSLRQHPGNLRRLGELSGKDASGVALNEEPDGVVRVQRRILYARNTSDGAREAFGDYEVIVGAREARGLFRGDYDAPNHLGPF